MNKRLSDLFDQVNPNEIENIEIEQELCKGEQKVSLERIKKLALEGIKETGLVEAETGDNIIELCKKRSCKERTSSEGTERFKREIEDEKLCNSSRGSKRGKHPRRLARRILIPLVAAVCLSVGAVAATHYNETLRNLFGQIFPYSEQIQSIEERMSVAGIVFTAEGAFIDDKTGLFIASFMKEDGTAFDTGTEAAQIRLLMEQSNAMGWNVYNELSEDKKKLICIVNLSSSQKLHGKALTLMAEDLKAWRNIKAVSPVSLSKTEQMPIEGNWKNYNSTDGLEAKLSETLEGLMLDRVYLSDEGLEIITSFADKEGIQDQYYDLSLVNQQTGESILASESEHYWSEEEDLNKDYTLFAGITAQDLEHLKLAVSSEFNEIITEADWEVSFSLNQNSQVISKKVNKIIKSGDETAFIRKIQVSALGVTIQGVKLSRDMTGFKNVYLELANGEKIDLWQSGMNSEMGILNLYLKGSSEENEKPDWASFIDISNIQSIVIDGERILLV